MGCQGSLRKCNVIDRLLDWARDDAWDDCGEEESQGREGGREPHLVDGKVRVREDKGKRRGLRSGKSQQMFQLNLPKGVRVSNGKKMKAYDN